MRADLSAAEMENGIIVGEDAALRQSLIALAQRARIVCFAGLPGTGKSLMIHQLAHLAHLRGRATTLLQWDTARPPFEASPAAQRYPQVDGVTHGLIRVAVGRWARDAIAAWHTGHPGAEQLLIAEAPLAGHRLIDLARPADDAAEPLLSDSSAHFVVPVPSRAVRQHLEAERARRMRAPQHARENEDAPPHVLRDLWQQLARVAVELGLAPPLAGAQMPYDPAVYCSVYLKVLSRRHAQALPLDVVLPSSALSAYDFKVPLNDLLPAEADVARCIAEAEQAFPEGTRSTALAYELEHWHD